MLLLFEGCECSVALIRAFYSKHFDFSEAPFAVFCETVSYESKVFSLENGYRTCKMVKL